MIRLSISYAILLLAFVSLAFSQSHPYADSLKNLLNYAEEDSVKRRLYEELGMYFRRRNQDSSIYFNRLSMDLARKMGDLETAAILSKDIGITLCFKGEYEESSEILHECLLFFEKSGMSKHESHVYSIFAMINDMQGKTDSALFYNAQGLAISKEINDWAGVARLKNNEGLLLQYTGKLEEGMAAYLMALRIQDSLNQPLKVANLLNNIASNHLLQENYQETLSYSQQSLEISEKEGDKYLMAVAYSQVGSAYFSMESYEKALDYFTKQLQLDRELGSGPADIGEAWVRIGESHSHLGNFQEALDAFSEAEKNFDPQVDKPVVAQLFQAKGKFWLDQKEYQQGLISFQEAGRLFEELKWKKELSESYDGLSKCYAGLRRFNDAYNFQGKSISLKDSVLNKDKVEAFAEMEERYESEKKEKEIFELEAANAVQELNLTRQLWISGISIVSLILIALAAFYLYRNNQIRRRQNQLLQAQKEEIDQKNQQNELLLKEVHHRVKNNLQSVSSLLNLQSESIEDETVREAVNQGKHRVQSIALLHQRLYQGTNLAAIEMKSYFQTLFESLFDAFGVDPNQITLEIDMEPYEMDIDKAVPLGLIANELMTNSLKYAFPENQKGEIKIQLSEYADNKLVLTIGDNGVGTGENGSKSKGTKFGSRLIQLLLIQLEGKMEVSTDKGYQSQILIPAS